MNRNLTVPTPRFPDRRNRIANLTTAAALIGLVGFAGCWSDRSDHTDDVVAAPKRINETKDAETGSTSDRPSSASMKKMAMPSPDDIVFKDDVESNVEAPTGLDGLVFLDTDGKRVSLESFLGKKNVVLVFTEGFGGGMLCPFCKTQTSRLVANYDKFANLDTEILVVYPGSRDHLDEFIEAATKTEKAEVDRVPFPLVLDEELSAVGYFNIKSNLAHPSTFIIDKRGNVQLAYVGADMTADRPSIAAILRVLMSANAH
ncbi:MAG: redoxin domain-containing protein [Planctomycetota bacterium]